MQIRRVLLLFALVLGLSALVASIAPAPDGEDEEPAPAETVAASGEEAVPLLKPEITLRVRRPTARPPTRRVRAGSSFSLRVPVPKPGDVVLDGLGLRQTAGPLTPAHFELLASPPGHQTVAFVPIDGPRRVVGRLAFVEAATVTPRRRDR